MNGARFEEWFEYKLLDGSTVLIPGKFSPKETA
jgi:hypothetical protein